MSIEEVTKELRRCMLLLQMATERIEKLSNEISEQQDKVQEETE